MFKNCGNENKKFKDDTNKKTNKQGQCRGIDIATNEGSNGNGHDGRYESIDWFTPVQVLLD